MAAARSFPIIFSVMLLFPACSCFAQAPSTGSIQPIVSLDEEERLLYLLKNMPVNSEQRCVGIICLAETMLDGTYDKVMPDQDAQEVAAAIYDAFKTSRKVTLPAHLKNQGRRIPITNRNAFVILAGEVANLYKKEFNRIVKSPTGKEAAVAAQSNILRKSTELEQLFSEDQDGTLAIFCFGDRYFPNDVVEYMYHAILLQKMPHDVYLVYDPNDPSLPIESALVETQDGLVLKWTCEFQKKGFDTTQMCHLVAKNTYFETLGDSKAEK